MKILNLSLAVIFALFAIVQLNDVDPFQWVLFYGLIALVCGLSAFGQKSKLLIVSIAVFAFVKLALLLPEFINWINMGAPTITGQMKAEEPHIEYTREFLGLFLGLGVMLYQWRKK